MKQCCGWGHHNINFLGRLKASDLKSPGALSFLLILTYNNQIKRQVTFFQHKMCVTIPKGEGWAE